MCYIMFGRAKYPISKNKFVPKIFAPLQYDTFLYTISYRYYKS